MLARPLHVCSPLPSNQASGFVHFALSVGRLQPSVLHIYTLPRYERIPSLLRESLIFDFGCFGHYESLSVLILYYLAHIIMFHQALMTTPITRVKNEK